MDSTGSEPEAASISGRAIPYTKKDGEWKDDSGSLPWRGTPAGGGYSTVGDMLRFATALLDGRLISAQLLEAATSPQNNKAWYGYGFMVSGQGNLRQFGHEGGAQGANAVFLVYPGKHYVVIGLSNFDPATMGNIANFFGRRLPL
jgi:CubicO group peptidase (beta-lactamase class C family)